MKIQLTTNFGCASGVESIQWFKTLGEAQDYCEKVIRKYEPSESHKKLIDKVQDCNVKGLTNLMTSLCKFKFEWVE